MIPTYNAAKTVEQTLESILLQSYTNLEIVIVDNVSTDNTVELVRRYDDPRLKIIINETNIGAEGNFTKCIELATGEYIAIYHADDVYNAQMIEREVDFLESHAECGAVFTSGNLINEKNTIIKSLSIPTDLCSQTSIYQFNYIFPALLKYGNIFFICPSAMVRKTVYKNDIIIWGNKRYGTASDIDVWLRILEKYPVGIINEPLMGYRQSEFHFSHNYNKMRTSRKDVFNVYDDYIEKYPSLVTKDIMGHYLFFIKRDELKRAFHYALLGNVTEAKQLTKNLFTWQTIKYAIQTIENMNIYILGVLLNITLRIGFGGLLHIFYKKRSKLR